MSYADQVFRANCLDILQNGVRDDDLTVRPHWEDGTPAHTIKKFGLVNRYDLQKEFPILTLRRTYLKSAVDELLWIWQKKSNNVHDLSSHIWDAWADLSLGERGISVEGIHVNFSAVMFGQPGVVERVRPIIGDSGVPFSQIVIEFTETALAEKPELVGEFAREMRQMGIRLGLDDFGTGYSNLSSVLALPFDTVKLDKSLVWAAVEQENTAVMVRALTEIFHRMGMRVLAEGVEDEVQNRFVLDCGIELIQGFLYARPLTGEEAAPLLAAKVPAR